VAPKVLFIYNDPTAPEALLGEAFTEQGFDVDTFEVVPVDRADDPVLDVIFPEPTDYDVIVPLGSRWAVYDDALRGTWVGSEMQMMLDAQAAGVPALGVCFGGQLLAQAHGGIVTRSTTPEIGWCQIDSDDRDLIPPGPWFEWHFDRWTPPAAATEIARNGKASQAFVLGRTLALQFHPELDTPLLELWLSGDEHTTALGVDPDELRARTMELQDNAALRIRALVNAFLDRVARRPVPTDR
jgi:GMP synthase-like glutamine amidotransferase